MKVTHIRLRRLVSHENRHGHDAVEIEAQVDDDEPFEFAMESLRGLVDGELAYRAQVTEMNRDLSALMVQVRSKERQLETLQRDIERNRGIVQQHDKLIELARANGLQEAVADLDEIPF